LEFRRQLNALVDVVPTCCKLAEDFFTARREQQAAARPHKRTASPSACWALAVVSCAHVGTPGARPDRLPAWSRLPKCRAGAQAHERARAARSWYHRAQRVVLRSEIRGESRPFRFKLCPWYTACDGTEKAVPSELAGFSADPDPPFTSDRYAFGYCCV